MGVVTSIRKSIDGCFEADQVINSNPRYDIILKDQQYIEEQSWHRLKQTLTVDYNKLIFMYQDYELDQEVMEAYWQKADTKLGQGPNLVRDSTEALSLKWKYAVRKGVPCSKVRQYCSEIFNLNLSNVQQNDYNKLIHTLFKGKIVGDFVNVPLFGIDHDNIHAALKIQCLSEEGVKALSRILWIINKTKTVQYCPMMVHVASFLLIFMQERQAYKILDFLIEDSISIHSKNQESLRWHFTLTESQFNKLAQSCFSEISSVSKTFTELCAHFDRNNIEKQTLFVDIVKDFFFCYLPFSFIYRIFIIYLNEGVKIFFRVIYAMLKECKNEVLQVTSLPKVKNILQERCLNMNRQQISSTLKTGFYLGLTKMYKKLEEYNSVLNEGNIRMYYFPHLQGDSQILTSHHLEHLWAMLPHLYKPYDPKIVFPSKSIGYSLAGLTNCLKQYNGKAIILVIQTTQRDIFGAFFQQNIMSQRYEASFRGSPQTFLFSLQPEIKCWRSSGANISYVHLNDTMLIFGSGGSGCGLQIDKDLKKGSTYACDTFNNPPLVSNNTPDFKIQVLQCLVLE